MSASYSEPSPSSSSVIPWGQRTRSGAQRREQQLMFQVLDNPSLREEILKRAIIIGGDKKVDRRTACTLRRVDKSWNESVLRILWQVHEPLYKVVPADGGNLDAFTKTFASSLSVSDPPPPLEVRRFSCSSQQTHLASLSNFMTRCGPALLQLGLIHYDFRAPLPLAFPSWTLSRLHKLGIFTGLPRRGLSTAGEQPQTQVATGQEKIPECLINAIFLGATALTELVLSVHDWSSSDYDMAIFESVTFPPTLVKLKLHMDLNLEQTKNFVQCLLKCSLPKVSSLSFKEDNDVFPEGILFSLMDKWKSTLKNLVIVGSFYRGPPRNVTAIRFPVMEQLEEFCMTSVTVQLEKELRSLERFFPKLHTLRLRNQTSGMFRKWTESSRFSGVTTEELTLADGDFGPEEEDDDDEDDDFFVSVNMEAMQLVNLAFPNLRKLALGISKDDPSGLWCVFREMRQLEELNLKVFGDLSERTTRVWDSILTGVPAQMMASLRRNGPQPLESGEGLVSILNLQELKSLSVEYDITLDNNDYNFGGSLISDFIFNHAFLRMPQLTHLQFEGPFKVSEEMTDRWTSSEEGRSLGYEIFSLSSDLQ